MIYLYFNSDILAIDRVKERHSAGGHDVPEEDIKRRYHSGLTSLAETSKNVDNASILDNLGKDFKIIILFYIIK